MLHLQMRDPFGEFQYQGLKYLVVYERSSELTYLTGGWRGIREYNPYVNPIIYSLIPYD